MLSGICGRLTCLSCRRWCWRRCRCRLIYLFVAEEGEEDVVEDLQGVDVQDALIPGNEAEVDEVCWHPEAPTGLHARQEILLHLQLEVCQGLALHNVEVAEVDGGKDRVPQDLVGEDFSCHLVHRGAWHQCVEVAVEVVARWAMPAKAEQGLAEGACHVQLRELYFLHARLAKNVPQSPADQRRQGLHKQWLFGQSGLIACPHAGRRERQRQLGTSRHCKGASLHEEKHGSERAHCFCRNFHTALQQGRAQQAPQDILSSNLSRHSIGCN
mmetsp:Transcript_104681/g.180839  ORF Transcript_104681/g.180839 Transcript_104681/m.180839 type:complete len:270 (-) Transcript_104681:109-918(-)